MSNQSGFLKIETLEKKFNNWILNFSIIEIDSLKINIHQNNSYNIYESIFKLNELQIFKSFTSKNSIKEIIDYISDSIEKNNIKIEETEKNSKLIIISDNISNELILNKKEKLSEEIIEILINQIEFLKNKNTQLEEKIKSLYERNEIIEEKISNIENETNLKNKSIMSISINGELLPQSNVVKINEIENKLNKIEFLNYSNSNSTQLTNCNLKQINSINPHYDSIKVISKLPSGNLISVSNDKSIKIYDNKLNIIQSIINAHDDYINDIDIKDENNFITCSSDKSIKIWIKKYLKGYVYNSYSFTLYQNIKDAHKDKITKVIYCSNGKIISSSWDKTIKIWEENKDNNYNCIQILKHSKWISSILLLNDKNILISSAKDGTKFWNLTNYKCINHIQETYCENNNSLKRLDEERIIIGGNIDGIMKVISIKEKIIIKRIKNEFKCLGICVIENKGVFLIGGESKEIKIYRSDNYECIKIIKDAHYDFINGFIQLKDSSVASYGVDKSVKIWSF